MSDLDVGIIATLASLVLGLTMLVYDYSASRASTLLQDTSSQCWMNRSADSAMVATGLVLDAKAQSISGTAPGAGFALFSCHSIYAWCWRYPKEKLEYSQNVAISLFWGRSISSCLV